MNEFTEALEGAVGLIAGGIVLLVFASAVGQVQLIDLSTWGVVYIVVGIVVLITVVVAAIMAFIGGRR